MAGRKKKITNFVTVLHFSTISLQNRTRSRGEHFVQGMDDRFNTEPGLLGFLIIARNSLCKKESMMLEIVVLIKLSLDGRTKNISYNDQESGIWSSGEKVKIETRENFVGKIKFYIATITFPFGCNLKVFLR